MKKWPLVREEPRMNRWLVDTGTKLHPLPRQRFYYETQVAAEEKADQLRDELEKRGKDALLTSQQVADALTAYHQLKEGKLDGTTLSEAVSFFVTHNSRSDATLLSRIQEFIEEKKGDQELRPAYRNCLHKYFNPLIAYQTENKVNLALQPMQSITRADLLAFFAQLKPKKARAEKTDTTKYTSMSRHNFYRYMRLLWNWAAYHGYIRLNPFDHLKAPKLSALSPYVLNFAEVQRLINTVEKPEWHYFKPYVYLGLFCGIRPAELQRLQWRAINTTEWFVHIDKDTAKRPKARSIPIAKNCQRMIEQYLSDPDIISRPILQIESLRERHDLSKLPNFERRFKAFTAAAGFKKWPQNAIRHTYASYLYRCTGEDSQLVRDRVGHAVEKTLFAHYLGQVPSIDIAFSYFTLGDLKTHAELDLLIHPYLQSKQYKQILNLLHLDRI